MLFIKSVIPIPNFIQRIRLEQDKPSTNALTHRSEQDIQKIQIHFTVENMQLPALISTFGKGNYWS